MLSRVNKKLRILFLLMALWISFTGNCLAGLEEELAECNQIVEENPDKAQKYMIYMNRYQMSAISKRVDAADDETMKLCHNLDSMEQFRIEVA